jgi:hypothetical protein
MMRLIGVILASLLISTAAIAGSLKDEFPVCFFNHELNELCKASQKARKGDTRWFDELMSTGRCFYPGKVQAEKIERDGDWGSPFSME